jgi:hypothetical protein
MKRMLVACLSFIVPVVAYVVVVGSLPMVSEAEAKKAPPKKGGGGDGVPDVLLCYFEQGATTPKPRPPEIIEIIDGDVDGAVAQCLGLGGHPHGLN